MTKKHATLVVLLSLTTLALLFCYILARPFLKSIVWAVVMAITFYPVHSRVQGRVRSPNGAAAISTALVLLIVILPATMIGLAVTGEVRDLYHQLSEQSAGSGGWGQYFLHFVEKPMGWVSRYVDFSKVNLRAEIAQRVQQVSAFLLAHVGDVAGNLAGLVINAIVAFFTLFFLFREGKAIRRRMAAIVPLDADHVERLFKGVNDTIVAAMYGVLAVGAAQGVLVGLAFWVLGLPSPILWGVVTSLFSMVPLVGSGAVWAPAVLLLVLSGSWGKGLLLLGWGVGVVGMVDNFVRPYVMSGQVKLHPLLLFFALLGGVKAFGLIGIFVGPVILAITMTLISLLREEGRSWQAIWRE